MVNVLVCLMALLAVPALWITPSHAADPGDAKFNEEILKQEKIYRGQGEDVTPGYTVDRALAIYRDGLAADFGRALPRLGPTDRWLDVGAGEGQAILDFFRARGAEEKAQPGKPQAVAMSIEDRRTAAWHETAARLPPNQIEYRAGRRLREYSVKELGQFEVITDVIGGFSYTTNLSLFMEKVLGFLVLDGSFYSLLQDVHRDDGSNVPFYPGAPFLTEIRASDGSEVKVCSWLKRIACVEVTCEATAEWQPPTEAYRVRKICNDVSVPELTPVHYEAGTPPERRFQIAK